MIVPELDAKIGIYQPIFKESIRQYLDPGFIALNWLHNPSPELRELALHQHILRCRFYEKHELTGLFSPKFFAKTGLAAHVVKKWIDKNPGHALYCFDGRPFIPYTAYNSVERGALSHHDFEKGMRQVCRAIGLDLPVELGRQTNQQTIHCNFWCATPAFWQRWESEIVSPILALAQDNTFPVAAVFRKSPYRSPTPALLIVFIYERLMSYYIQIKGIDAVMYPWSAERILGLSLQPLMKDYLADNMPWIDEIDRRGQWTPADRSRLADTFNRLRSSSDFRLHDASDLLDSDLPSRKPPTSER